MTTSWKFIKAVLDGELFTINGMNIWDYKWEDTGERVEVKDPLYGQHYSMAVYKIRHRNVEFRFAAGEFSNCVWGLYQEGI